MKEPPVARDRYDEKLCTTLQHSHKKEIVWLLGYVNCLTYCFEIFARIHSLGCTDFVNGDNAMKAVAVFSM